MNREKAPRKRLAVESLKSLADQISIVNKCRYDMATLLGEPAEFARIGEHIASAIFDIQLASHRQPGYDGVFCSGPLVGQKVNVKTYMAFDWCLDFDFSRPHAVEYYLVLARLPNARINDDYRPFAIDRIFLLKFEDAAMAVYDSRTARGELVYAGSKKYSIRQIHWLQAQIYPAITSLHSVLKLTSQQCKLLEMFSQQCY